ncbi:cuticle protein 67-like [Schistocerca serialis cubense]|uniref:cuticle protein 67-like n=1 Tax=Schistocerca nitens TaxID=7011 RepID=UPI002119071C|nr:cuticle protein 67-like [Schistocerca nitens]XP_049952163.1 cuticle protein 67-like [Schistocerca serialis cubense]XP_049952165.1 cuticle protein 67-like [Schistocerca serialis cubense]
MAFKLFVLAAVLAVARAGYLSAPAAVSYAAPAVSYAAPAVAYAAPAAYAPAALTSQSSNILRSFGNLGQVSTYTKTIDTPYSSVTKSDVRVSNDAIAHVAAPVAYAAAPAYHAPAYYHG